MFLRKSWSVYFARHLHVIWLFLRQHMASPAADWVPFKTSKWQRAALLSAESKWQLQFDYRNDHGYMCFICFSLVLLFKMNALHRQHPPCACNFYIIFHNRPIEATSIDSTSNYFELLKMLSISVHTLHHSIPNSVKFQWELSISDFKCVLNELL